MTTVRIKDSRYGHGFRLEFFKTNIVNNEVINYVKKNIQKVQIVSDATSVYTPEEFMNTFCR